MPSFCISTQLLLVNWQRCGQRDSSIFAHSWRCLAKGTFAYIRFFHALLDTVFNAKCCPARISKVGRAGLQPNADFPKELPVDARQGANWEQLATELEQLRLLLNHLAEKSEP